MARRVPKCWLQSPRRECQIRLAKWYAARCGFTPKSSGGWIYKIGWHKPVAQGWPAFYERYRCQILAELAALEVK